MTASQMMTGPEASGAVVKCWRRGAANIQAGDWLPEYGAHVLTAPIEDPTSNREAWWVTLSDGRDVSFTRRGKVWLYRQYAASPWVAQATEEYRDARLAWERDRENVALGYATEMREYGQERPAPRLADFLRQAAAARREVMA